MLKRLRDTRTCFLLLAVFIILMLTACGANASTPTPTLAPLIETPAPPTATSVPAAAMVNDEVISLEEFNAELLRFQNAQAALGNEVFVEEAGERVLNDLIDQVLLAQAAHEAGYTLGDTELETRVEALAAEIGGAENLSTWLASYGYTSESFRLSLKRAVEAAWMRDTILTDLSGTAEQVHAQQILLYNLETANDIQSKLEAGVDFGDLATAYDPKTNGELGWFPRGYLLEASIEEAAFSLEIGQPSAIIESEVGFHIIMVLERAEDRPLSPDALLTLQEQALKKWLQARRETSRIEQ
ncbi:MAG: hypothetical protein HN855_08490 [Anaerolineae bacterium]|nr:hypothetical protein [Anaerolineae bacterium]MBT7069413.1 hypothetical protein [Anaerolineae bacterium]MBT7325181.1 hypothetical protein [Anaerolineae bacterium]